MCACPVLVSVGPLVFEISCYMSSLRHAQCHMQAPCPAKSLMQDCSGTINVREFRMMLWSGGFTLSDDAVLSMMNEIGVEPTSMQCMSYDPGGHPKKCRGCDHQKHRKKCFRKKVPAGKGCRRKCSGSRGSCTTSTTEGRIPELFFRHCPRRPDLGWHFLKHFSRLGASLDGWQDHNARLLLCIRPVHCWKSVRSLEGDDSCPT